MSLSGWTKYTNQGWNLIVNVLTPIVSSGTGRFAPAPFGGGTNTANIVVTNASLRTKGVTRGKLRSLFRYDVPSTSGIGLFGLSFMQSIEAIGTTSGNFYKVHYDHNTGRLHLMKGTTTLVNAGTQLAQSTIVTPGNNVVFSLEVEWVTDVTELGGVAMFVRFGFATDFSDLTTQITYLDTASPFITSVAEGIFISTGNPVGADWNLDFDQTTLFIP